MIRTNTAQGYRGSAGEDCLVGSEGMEKPSPIFSVDVTPPSVELASVT